MRALSSLGHEEIGVEAEAPSDSDLRQTEERWAAFCRTVAEQAVERFKTAKELCEFLRAQVRLLGGPGSPMLGGEALIGSVAGISPNWCAALLEELLSAEDSALDGFLWPLIRQAETKAPDAYRKAVESLPIGGRPGQLSTLVSYLGRKHLHGEGLSQFERQAILESTRRTEEVVVSSLALVAGLHFSGQPEWAIEVLRQLKPTGERAADAILRALGQLSEKHAAKLNDADIARSLANLGHHCFAETTSDGRDLEKVARRFPKLVYEQIRNLHERAEADPTKRNPRQFADTLSLGPINDPEYVDREIQALWRKAVSADNACFSQEFRLALIRSLLWSKASTASDRIRKIVAESKSGGELKLAAEIAATPGSRFVFQSPD